MADYSLDRWKRAIAQTASTTFGIDIATDELTMPPDVSQGHLAFPVFRVAKLLGETPDACAKRLVQALTTRDFIAQVEYVRGYVNVWLPDAEVASSVLQDIQTHGERYGSQPTSADAPLLLEYASPNTHKEIHLGHVRNFTTGIAMSRIMQYAGMPLHIVSFVNDQGVNVAKTLWRMVQALGGSAHDMTQESVAALLAQVAPEKRTGNQLGQWYTEAVIALEENQEAMQDVSEIQKKLELRDAAWERLWQETRDWCLQELFAIYDELGIRVERTYLESEFLERAAQVVDELLAKGVATPSQGAVIVDLEDEKLGVCLVRKSDGNLLYISKDLALAEQKKQDYPNAQAFAVLADDRQALHFRQLNSILRRMGFGVPYEGWHHALLTLKEGIMSSRKGNVVTYQMLRDALRARAREGVQERHPEWYQARVTATAQVLADGAMKFSVLKSDVNKLYTFDMESSLSFDGMTGPYCQYAIVRMRSIAAKAAQATAQDAEAGNEEDSAPHASERALVWTLAQFPHVVQRASVKRNPALIAQWCFETAQAVNAFYRDVPVLRASADARAERLALCDASRIALTNGLNLLGISPLDEM